MRRRSQPSNGGDCVAEGGFLILRGRTRPEGKNRSRIISSSLRPMAALFHRARLSTWWLAREVAGLAEVDDTQSGTHRALSRGERHAGDERQHMVPVSTRFGPKPGQGQRRAIHHSHDVMTDDDIIKLIENFAFDAGPVVAQ